MYTTVNFKTKKALKEAVASGQEVSVFQPGIQSSYIPANGDVSVEGPHYPKPHTWYAEVTLRDGKIVGVK